MSSEFTEAKISESGQLLVEAKIAQIEDPAERRRSVRRLLDKFTNGEFSERYEERQMYIRQTLDKLLDQLAVVTDKDHAKQLLVQVLKVSQLIQTE